MPNTASWLQACFPACLKKQQSLLNALALPSKNSMIKEKKRQLKYREPSWAESA